MIAYDMLQNWGNEKLEEAQDTTIENPWDVESWAMLLRVAQTRWINDVRSFFERLVTTFPTSGRYWKYYIEMEVCIISIIIFIICKNGSYIEKVVKNNSKYL